VKTGMKRLRDGSIGRVPYVQPEGYREGRSGLLEYVNTEGRVECLMIRMDGTLWGEFGQDIVEHLSDELHDPRTWRPEPDFKEGLWRHKRGNVDLYIGPAAYVGSVWISKTSGLEVGGHYKWKDLCAGDNPPVEYIGPNPLKGPTE
jgi:hypothetical protein